MSDFSPIPAISSLEFSVFQFPMLTIDCFKKSDRIFGHDEQATGNRGLKQTRRIETGGLMPPALFFALKN